MSSKIEPEASARRAAGVSPPVTASESQRPPVASRWSLAARLTAWYAGSAFLLILGATGFLYWALIANLDREDDHLLAAKVHILRRALRDRPGNVAALRQEVEWQRVGGQHLTIFVRIL